MGVNNTLRTNYYMAHYYDPRIGHFMRRAAIFLVVFLASSQSFAQWQVGGMEVPDEPWRRSVNGFQAMLVVTNKPDAFFEAWNKSPSPDYKPEILTTSEARRGDTAVAVVFFTKCLADQSGNCNSEVDFKLLRPDGSVYAEYKGAELLKGRSGLPEGALQLGVANLRFRVEFDDPLGDYRIEAVVRDKFAGIEVPLVQVLKVLPTPRLTPQDSNTTP